MSEFAGGDTRRIHCSTQGEGPALLLVPGLGSGAKLFGTLPRRFAKDGFRALSFDPLGVPPSAPLPGDYDFVAAADDLVAVMDHFEVERCSLVGTSLGGKVALVCSARHPDRVDGLVMLASAAVKSARGRRVYRFFERVARHVPEEDFAEVVAPFLFGRSFHESRPAVIEDIIRATRPGPDTRALMGAQARALADFDGEAQASQVAVPTLCVAGDEDTLTMTAEVEATAARIPGARFERFAHAGHSLLLEDAAVYETVRSFLSDS